MVDQNKNNVLPLELAYVQSPYEYAEIVSIDTSEAIKVPGVVSIITANDIPGDNNILGTQGSCELLAEKFPQAAPILKSTRLANEDEYVGKQTLLTDGAESVSYTHLTLPTKRIV